MEKVDYAWARDRGTRKILVPCDLLVKEGKIFVHYEASKHAVRKCAHWHENDFKLKTFDI